ncbi:MAG: DNA polymerase I, partial [Armatimonadetes bacterium]|nr:DNA polymerase I [Armatimonadota bacterium]
MFQPGVQPKPRERAQKTGRDRKSGRPSSGARAANPVGKIPGAVPKNKKLVVIDGYSLLFRAFFGTRYLSTSDGRPTNALFGFVSMLYNILENERPESILVAFDAPGKTFRDEQYAEYKGTRTKAPDELSAQLAGSRELIAALGIPQLELTGFEADDIIATYARLACEAQATATIVSSDKDLMQLVNDCVTMYDTMKDKRIGPAEVVEKFGVPPDKVIEVQALIGDSTDNVPGVPGIGVKTAAQLIGEYGDLET